MDFNFSKKQIIGLVGILILLLGVLSFYLYNFFVHAQIHFLDVGQGDSILIHAPHNQQMLIDCGYNDIVIEALGRKMNYFDRTIEYLVVTHSDRDHFGGCLDVLDKFEVKNFIYNGLNNKNFLWKKFIEKLRAENVNFIHIKNLQQWELDKIKIQSLFPDLDLKTNKKIFPKKDQTNNNFSVVLKVEAGEQSFLLLGDAEVALEKYLAESFSEKSKEPEKLKVDYLKTGHHGSKTSTTELILQKTQPQKAIISVGAENKFGHPSGRVISRLNRYKVQIYRTDMEGDISFMLY